ncbi:unnamed protein product [Clavelina lepadiformis]|uniref:Cysteine protease n=1 Tax=Clavelina lepadiformis TaxID=159417 RepID=A0ABP0G5U4_CLALP
MLRTAQMMVAQCLCKHFLGCGWRWVTKSSNSFEAHMHQEIIKWFLDDASPECPFSVHRLTELGLNYQCNPGDWYGPGTVAYIMQDAMECAKSAYTQLNQLVLYVAQDCTVYSKDVKEMCGWRNLSVDNGSNKSKSQEVAKKSVLILIPVRLGEATLNSVYIPCLQALLTLDQTMGIIGGKRTHSLYFVGFQDEHLICLDPHYCQSADSLLTFTHDSLTTYHSLSPKKIAVSKLDPSCCLCFYCRDESDFQSFVGEFNKCIIPPKQKTKYPLCVIQEGSSRDYKMNLSSTRSNFVSSFEVNEKVLAANQAHCLSQTKPDNAIAFSDSSENLPQEKCSSCSKVTHNTKQRTDKLSFSLPIKFLTSFSGNQTCSAERRDSSHEDEFEFL